MAMDLTELLGATGLAFEARSFVPERTALLLVDMQVLATGAWLVYEAEQKGIARAAASAAVEELDARLNLATENARRVLDACRRVGVRPIHVKIESLTKDGADVGRLHKRHHFYVTPGSPWGAFLEPVAPRAGEIVLTKTCSNAFVGTNLDRVLRNLGVEQVIVVGFYTDQCIESAARDAADLGYDVTLVADACAALTQAAHDHALAAITNVYVRKDSTTSVVTALEAAAPAGVSALGGGQADK